LKLFYSFLLDGAGVKWLFNVVEFSQPVVLEALVEGVKSLDFRVLRWKQKNGRYARS
jgi:hypothetical protein